MSNNEPTPADTSTSEPVPGFQNGADPNESKPGSSVERPGTLTPFAVPKDGSAPPAANDPATSQVIPHP
ncbi:MAG: hypothetical protein JWP29_5062 [Rhodoferax sp.]|nr:hypothetical protein [Rhodoferax sp.]